MNDPRTAWRDGVVQLRDGRQLSYAEHGPTSGPTVLHFPPSPGWRGMGLAISDVRVVTIERPGTGRSSRQPGRRIGDWPADVAAVADALELNRFGVVGTSGGGPYALATAAHLAERTAAVALRCSGSALFDRPDLDVHLGPSEANLVPLVRADPEGSAAAIPEFVKPTAEAWNADPAAGWESFLATVGDLRPRYELAAHQWKSALTASYADPAGWGDEVAARYLPWGFDPAQITVPVRAWHGDDDRACPLDHLMGVLSTIPGSQLSVQGGQGHYLPSELDTEIREWILSHLERTQATDAASLIECSAARAERQRADAGHDCATSD
jgi:pimeloyl-ACP methyl ester carboxylesterase